MDEHQSDLIIKSATLLAKDLLLDNRFFNYHATSLSIDSDSGDDLDLFFYSQLMKKRKKSPNANDGAKSKGKVISKQPTSNAETSKNPPMNHLFLKFLQECEDITFENQFKMTRTTFQVRNIGLLVLKESSTKVYVGSYLLVLTSFIVRFQSDLFRTNVHQSLTPILRRFNSKASIHLPLIDF